MKWHYLWLLLVLIFSCQPNENKKNDVQDSIEISLEYKDIELKERNDPKTCIQTYVGIICFHGFSDSLFIDTNVIVSGLDDFTIYDLKENSRSFVSIYDTRDDYNTEENIITNLTHFKESPEYFKTQFFGPYKTNNFIFHEITHNQKRSVFFKMNSCVCSRKTYYIDNVALVLDNCKEIDDWNNNYPKIEKKLRAIQIGDYRLKDKWR